MTFQAFWKIWKTFWFQPITPEPVALFRILLGSLLLQLFIVSIGSEFLNWYGSHAVVQNETVRRFFWNSEPRFDLLLAFPTDRGLLMYFYSVIVATVFMTLGFCTRFSCVYVALALVSMHHHNPFNINGGDAFVRLMTMYLCFSNCGDCFSVDRWIAEKRNKSPLPLVAKPAWALRMIQVQLAIVYLHTFICKVNGLQWWDGTAVYFATRLEDLMRLRIPLFDSLLFCQLLSWYTLVVEFAMFTLVWIKEMRYFVLAAAFILHFGIDLAINLPVFEWAFIFALVTFIEPEDIRRILNRAQEKLSSLQATTPSNKSKPPSAVQT